MITFIFTSIRGDAITIGEASRHLNEDAVDIRKMLEKWATTEYKPNHTETRGAYTYLFTPPDQWGIATIDKLNHRRRVIRTQLVSMELTI